MRSWNMKSKLFIFALAIVLLGWITFTWVVTGTAAGPQTVNIVDASWNAVTSGGTTMTSTSYILHGSLGQPVVGESMSSSYILISGYWSDLRTFIHEFFLTLIRGS